MAGGPGPDAPSSACRLVQEKGKQEKESAMGRGQLETCTTPEYWVVAEALESLRPDHRKVLLETYYRGRSVAEAAATLGIPAEIVKSRTLYALKAFKLALQERGLDPDPNPPG
jgi:RNA polymerase sigma-70 factor (ECF subfamily)